MFEYLKAEMPKVTCFGATVLWQSGRGVGQWTEDFQMDT